MKNTKKTNKKEFKPDYTLDFSKIKNYTDLVIALTGEKVKAGKTIDIADLNAYTKACLDYIFSTYPLTVKIARVDCTCHKEPWYKRLWNKLKYAFNW